MATPRRRRAVPVGRPASAGQGATRDPAQSPFEYTRSTIGASARISSGPTAPDSVAW
ncbi:MAG TPA: hypothetical protein VMT17_06125 [Anaeromyxobacteraceae bacterium]|nr:hypothetical protein [Anaeromyxobacteraceae bacterium]